MAPFSKAAKQDRGLDEQSDKERRFHAALRTASNILGYGDCPEKKLRDKLMARGYEEQIISDVVDRLIGAELLDEERMASRRAEYLYRVKGYGPRRIYPELRRLGYRSDAVDAIEFDEDTYDFVSRCAQLLQKRSEIDQKALAALSRYGYTADQIRKAVALVRAQRAEEEECT